MSTKLTKSKGNGKYMTKLLEENTKIWKNASFYTNVK